MTKINIINGDITQARVEAIVNAANPMMLGGGGVDGAIHRSAGPKLLEACYKVEAINGVRCPTGQARLTTAGDLYADYVIHTVGPVYTTHTNPALILESAYRESLNIACSKNIKTIAFPAISCGVYGYPLDEAARIALKVCSREKYQYIEISFYLLGKKCFDIWQTELNKLCV